MSKTDTKAAETAEALIMINAMKNTHKAISDKKNNALDERRVSKYEEFLKDLYFPSEHTNNQIKKMSDVFLKAVSKQISNEYQVNMDKSLKTCTQTFKNVMNNWSDSRYDLIKNTVYQDSEQEWKIIGQKYEDFEHKRHILKTTLITRRNLISFIIAEMKNGKYSEALNKIPNLRELLKEYIIEYNKLLAIYKTDRNDSANKIPDKIDFKTLGANEQSVIQQIKILDDCYSNFVMAAPKITAVLFGDVIEWSLGYATNLFTNYAIAATRDEMIEKLTQDKIVKYFGSDNNGKVGDKIVDIHLDEKTYQEIQSRVKKQLSFSQNFKTGKSGESTDVDVKYDYDSTSRQQKIDVSVSVPVDEDVPSGQQLQLQISAKNWSNLKTTRDFGPVSLLNILLRTYQSVSPTETYMKVLGTHKTKAIEGSMSTFVPSKNEITLAHQMARWAIFLDTVIGFSQAQGSVNTLVLFVRDQVQRPVRVYSVPILVDRVWDGILNNTVNDSDFLDYNSADIRRQIQKNYRSKIPEQERLSRSYSTLAKIKTSMRYLSSRKIWA